MILKGRRVRYPCIMAKKDTSFNYETLVRYMLPQGILDSFEITKVEEEVTSERDETGTIIRILHIWLEERDTGPPTHPQNR